MSHKWKEFLMVELLSNLEIKFIAVKGLMYFTCFWSIGLIGAVVTLVTILTQDYILTKMHKRKWHGKPPGFDGVIPKILKYMCMTGTKLLDKICTSNNIW